MKALHVIAFILLIVGGLNWGIIGIWGTDVVAMAGDAAARVIYVLVGISALVELFTHKRGCKACDVSHAAPAPSAGPTPTV